MELITENNYEDAREIGREKRKEGNDFALRSSVTTRFNRSFHKASRVSVHCFTIHRRVDGFAFCRRRERFQFRREEGKRKRG